MIEKTLRLAIEAGYAIQIVYMKDGTQLRRLKPRALQDGLLVAMDLDKHQVRRFSLDRILAAEIIREEA